MTNRKIIIKSGNNLSSFFPLNNVIPQGSPISVILLLIAYTTYLTMAYPRGLQSQ